MKVISIINSKGGVGKSTILSNLISLCFEMNFSVLYSDLDRQKSLTIWGKKNKRIKCIESDKFDRKKLNKNSKYDFFFIDTPAAIKEKMLDELIRISDTIIIPTSNSYIELLAFKRFLKRILKFKRIYKKQIGILPIINRIRYSKNLSKMITKYEKIINQKFVACFPATKIFDDQMNKGSYLVKSNYAQKDMVHDQLLNIIKKF